MRLPRIPILPPAPAHRTMHTLSLATGIAVSRLATGGPALIQAASQYAELARVRLVLDVPALAAAMMFTQPLILRWGGDWKFAYSVGLILGVKFTTEGFYTSDVIEHLAPVRCSSRSKAQSVGCEARSR